MVPGRGPAVTLPVVAIDPHQTSHSPFTSDGEIPSCFRQRKSDLRDGDRITLFHLLKHLYPDELAKAGGDGVDMLRRIKRNAVRLGPTRY
jgi:hypothetical protein